MPDDVEIVKCLCGAEPIIEKKPNAGNVAVEEVFKIKCPNCGEKELPWMGQWHDHGALQIWNNIAQKRNYHKRTLDYNECGMCVSPPFKIVEWVNKKKTYEKITIKFYFDNSMYYYCYDYWYGKGGHGFGLWIGDHCYPSFEIASKSAMKKLIKENKSLKKIVEGLLMPEPVQGELF